MVSFPLLFLSPRSPRYPPENVVVARRPSWKVPRSPSKRAAQSKRRGKRWSQTKLTLKKRAMTSVAGPRSRRNRGGRRRSGTLVTNPSPSPAASSTWGWRARRRRLRCCSRLVSMPSWPSWTRRSRRRRVSRNRNLSKLLSFTEQSPSNNPRLFFYSSHLRSPLSLFTSIWTFQPISRWIKP